MKDLDKLIAEETEKLNKLAEKRAKIDDAIKKAKSNIEKYTLAKDREKVAALSNALDGKGVSFDDILAAVQNGDLLSLQEKMEKLGDNTDSE